MTAPMSETELRDIENDITRRDAFGTIHKPCSFRAPRSNWNNHLADAHVPDLLAEVRRLQSELAAQHLLVAGAQEAWQALDGIMVDHGMDHKAQPAAAQRWLRERLGELAAMKDRRCETCAWYGSPYECLVGPNFPSRTQFPNHSDCLWTPRQTTKAGDAP